MNDDKIIELYFQRNEDAISETQLKYGRYCNKIAFNILKNREDADECENDTYLSAWNAIPPTIPNVLSAFLGKITRNLALKKYRAQHAEKRLHNESTISLDELSECIPDSNGFDDSLREEELALIIDSFLRGLNDVERRVFICRYWYCDSIKDISTQFQYSESKVKMLLLRTRKKLQSYLNEKGVFI